MEVIFMAIRRIEHIERTSPRGTHYRPARPEDAPALAELVNMAGEGLPLYLWSRMAEAGETPWDVGRRRAMREEGSFSFRNALILERERRTVACLIGYPLPDQPEPIDYREMPPLFVPMQELENLAPGTWYVNVLATYPDCRGLGYGSHLLAIAEGMAVDARRNGLSIIVSDANIGARRLYGRCGYREIAQRPMVKEDWDNPGEHWVLLTKSI
jgi:ribosomal protein S18 acetylase RimI-like enzyme